MGAPRHEAGWTDVRTAQAIKLWKEGKSAEEVARAVGGGVTRNAVIGKMSRTGNSRPRSSAKAAMSQKPKPRPKPVRPARPARMPEEPRALAADATPAVPRVEPAPPPPEPAVQGVMKVSLVDLPRHGCKWPIGIPQPVQLFCGRPQDAPHPYCSEHAKVAYPSSNRLAKHSASELVRSVRRYI